MPTSPSQRKDGESLRNSEEIERMKREFWEPSEKKCRATGKRTYAGQSLARIAMHRQCNMANYDGKPMDIYHCFECDGWHVGHIPPWKRWSPMKRLGVL